MNDSARVVCSHCNAVNRTPLARLTQNPSCGRCHHRLFDAKPVELNQTSFRTHAERSDIPLVVDFWAPWCGPCHAMAPAFEAAAAQLEPNVRFGKVNTEQESALAASFNIRAIPTLAVFRNGREIARQSGAMPLPQLVAWIRRAAF